MMKQKLCAVIYVISQYVQYVQCECDVQKVKRSEDHRSRRRHQQY